MRKSLQEMLPRMQQWSHVYNVSCWQIQDGVRIPTVTAVLAIYGLECVMKYSYARHSAPRVLPLEVARRVRRDFTVPIVVRHAPVAVI